MKQVLAQAFAYLIIVSLICGQTAQTALKVYPHLAPISQTAKLTPKVISAKDLMTRKEFLETAAAATFLFFTDLGSLFASQKEQEITPALEALLKQLRTSISLLRFFKTKKHLTSTKKLIEQIGDKREAKGINPLLGYLNSSRLDFDKFPELINTLLTSIETIIDSNQESSHRLIVLRDKSKPIYIHSAKAPLKQAPQILFKEMLQRIEGKVKERVSQIKYSKEVHSRLAGQAFRLYTKGAQLGWYPFNPNEFGDLVRLLRKQKQDRQSQRLFPARLYIGLILAIGDIPYDYIDDSISGAWLESLEIAANEWGFSAVLSPYLKKTRDKLAQRKAKGRPKIKKTTTPQKKTAIKVAKKNQLPKKSAVKKEEASSLLYYLIGTGIVTVVIAYFIYLGKAFFENRKEKRNEAYENNLLLLRKNQLQEIFKKTPPLSKTIDQILNTDLMQRPTEFQLTPTSGFRITRFISSDLTEISLYTVDETGFQNYKTPIILQTKRFGPILYFDPNFKKQFLKQYDGVDLQTAKLIQFNSFIGPDSNDWIILKQIGEGGMGRIFLAWDSRKQRLVAIKTLISEGENKKELVSRFSEEIKALKKLNSPNIVKIYNYGKGFYFNRTAFNDPYYVMEYIEGISLEQLIKKLPNKEELQWPQIIQMIQQIAQGLSHAHAKGVIHRDIKAENIVLTKSGEIKIVDFGIAKRNPQNIDLTQNTTVEKLTQTGVIIGSPHYMSPEQAQAKDSLDHRTDIYSLGVLLFYLLTKTTPFEGNDILSLLLATTSKEKHKELWEELEKKKHYPEALYQMAQKAMALNPEDRYFSLEELLEDLRTVTNNPIADLDKTLLIENLTPFEEAI